MDLKKVRAFEKKKKKKKKMLETEQKPVEETNNEKKTRKLPKTGWAGKLLKASQNRLERLAFQN